MYFLWWLSLVVQWCKNYMAVSVGCMLDVWTPAITWHSFGPPHWAIWWRLSSAAGWCSQCVWSWYVAFRVFDVTVCIIFFVTYVKSEAGVRHFSGRCLWLTALCLECSGVSALCTCWLSCRRKLNGDAMSYHPPQFVANVHLYYGTAVNVPVIWCVMLLVSYVLSRLGGHWDDTLWYIQDPVWWRAQCQLMWSSMDKARIVQCLSLHTSFWTCAMFFGLMTVWGCSCLGVSVIHCLSIQNIHCQFTAVVCGTRVAPCIWLSV
jgi:hypothetical protein